MVEPLACCVMLTRDRPQMAKRAVECFRLQTYQRRKLLVIDTGSNSDAYVYMGREGMLINEQLFHNPSTGARELTIGSLRNLANGNTNADVLIHWDDDDYSHPNRIEEQVALLQSSGKQAVGYRDMLFWRKCERHEMKCNSDDAQAWLYSNKDPRYCLGTSLCYWRSAWEARPFQNISRGEDKAWLRDMDAMGIHSIPSMDHRGLTRDLISSLDSDPRMIASIHGGNHVVYEPEKSPGNFKRVPEFDALCRERMSL